MTAKGTLIDAFAAVVDRYPDRTAVRYGARALTYRQLDERSARWAGRLRTSGAAGRGVAVLAERGVEMVVAALAALRAGGHYVPLDPATPPARLAAMLDDAASAVVIASAGLAGTVPSGVPVILVDDLDQASAAAVPATPTDPAADAYVIFTSGTTGRPKGVRVSHANVIQLFHATAGLFGYRPDDVWTLVHSFGFDFSVWEMWGPLLSGAAIEVVPADVVREPAALRALIRQARVSVLSQTPTAFTRLVAEDAGHQDLLPLRWVVLGGEALHVRDCARWLDKYGDSSPALMNMYGITEVTVHATYHRVTRADLDRPGSVIGRPLPGQHIRLVDEHLAPVPDGTVGEIVVTGPGVAAGYVNRSELTGQRFVALPGGVGSPVRGYRSGDLAVRAADGELEYRGRRDDQVKIRGHRIELGEIQAVLAAAPSVAQAAVLARTDSTGSPVVAPPATPAGIHRVRHLLRSGPASATETTTTRIVAYVVADNDLDADRVFGHLRASLPPYMMPAYVVEVPEIPVNRNGKLDGDRLPAPAAGRRLRPSGGPSAPGGDPDERVQMLGDAFREVLDLADIGPDDSFFTVGGDSILALDLCAAAARRGLAVELAHVYDLQTPRAIAAAVTGTADADTTGAFRLLDEADRALLPPSAEDAYPLATLQAGVLFHTSFGTEGNMYCDIFRFRLRALFDRDRLQRAVDRAVARHDILRTTFHFTGFSQPLQVVHTTGSASLTVVDLTDLDQDGQQAALDSWLDKEISTPYALDRPPLLRISVHLLGADDVVLWLGFHDALLDGWSEASLLTEILVDYAALAEDPDRPPRPRPARRFADFVALELDVLADEEVRNFWSAELSGVEPMLLPRLGTGDPDVHSGQIAFLGVDLDPDLAGRLERVARERGATLKHALLAVHAKVQAVLNTRDQVLLGVESNGRSEKPGGTEVLGTHLNVVPYRIPTRGRSWAELIDAVRAKESEVLRYRRYPYARLQHLVGVPELSDILFNYTHFHGYRALSSTGIGIVAAEGYNRTNLTLRVEFNRDPFAGQLTLDLEANRERVAEEQLLEIGELYRAAFVSLIADVRAVPRTRDLLGPKRTAELVATARGPHEPPGAASWFDLFAASVAARPGAIAAVCGERSITYADLARRVDRTANWLSGRGVGRGTAVGVAAGRGLDHLVAVLAVLRAGGVYLPLPAGPEVRVRRMLRRACPLLVLCDDGFRPAIGEAAATDLGIELAELAPVGAGPDEPYDGPTPDPRDVAYALFTSGSTGEPKGALIRHDGMLNHIEAKISALNLGPADRVSQDAAATFDISVWQWLAPLAVGATTVIYPDEIGQDPPALLRALARDGVTVLEVTPPVLNVLRAELAHHGVAAFPPFALRVIASQAETLVPAHANAVRTLLPTVRLLNMWGATELSDDCTHHELVGDADERAASVPIGQPIRNTAVYVLDRDGDPVPTGSPGELYAGGVGVGAGYLNDQERTAASFVPDPFAGEPDALMYRTGDRGRRLATGALEFLGRVDNQLKIRGQRIELGEIAGALSAVTEVRESAVVVRGRGDARQLVGFFVPMAPDVSVGQVRAALAKALPRYAIPELVVPLDALPRTAHGKVDTAALAIHDLSTVDDGRPTAVPATATEAAILDIWARLLPTAPLAPDANFFERGGHSLHATQAMARLADQFGVALPVRLLFQYPTARELAARVDAAVSAAGNGAAGLPPIPPRPPGRREFPLADSQSSLWFIHELDPEDRSYEYGNLIRLSGPLDVAALTAAIDTLARRHEILAMRFGSRDGEPYQYPVPEQRIRLQVENVPDGPVTAGDHEAMLGWARDRHRWERFDLVAGPVAVARLHRFSPTEHVLEWSSHHIVSDGWSNGVALREIQEAYLARCQGRPPRLPDLPAQYSDYACWQRNFLRDSPQITAQLEYWREQLAGYTGDLGLATDFDRVDGRSRAAGYVAVSWDTAASARLREFARGHGITPFMLFHAAVAAIVARFGQQSDVVLGAAVASRTVPGTENLIGFFANTLPFRYRVDLDAPFGALFATVRPRVLSGLEHQLAPFQEIVKIAGIPRHAGVPPLVQVFVAVDAYPFDPSGFPGLTVTRTRLPATTSLFDLVFEFIDEPELRLTVQYDASLFRHTTAQRLAVAVERLLDALVSRPDLPVRAIPLLDAADRAALSRAWQSVAGTALGPGGPAGVINSPHWSAFVDAAERDGLLAALVLAP